MASRGFSWLARIHIQIELSALPDALIRNRSTGRSRENRDREREREKESSQAIPRHSVHPEIRARILAIVPEPLGLPRLMEIPGEKLVKTRSLCIRIEAEASLGCNSPSDARVVCTGPRCWRSSPSFRFPSHERVQTRHRRRHARVVPRVRVPGTFHLLRVAAETRGVRDVQV